LDISDLLGAGSLDIGGAACRKNIRIIRDDRHAILLRPLQGRSYRSRVISGDKDALVSIGDGIIDELYLLSSRGRGGAAVSQLIAKLLRELLCALVGLRERRNAGEFWDHVQLRGRRWGAGRCRASPTTAAAAAGAHKQRD